MVTSYIPLVLREQIRQQAAYRCEYCQTAEWLIGAEHEIDHIKPRSREGLTVFENLCLDCSSCNGYKLAKTYGADPETGEQIPLFHPRQQRWHDHFAWNPEGTQILGLTPCGRTTIEALRLNHPLMSVARSIWVSAGHHPPKHLEDQS
jgi:hypothetical protein